MERDERLATNVTTDVKIQFRIAAAERNMRMSELLRDIVHDWLDEHANDDID